MKQLWQKTALQSMLLAALALGLAGCGGGSSSTSTPTSGEGSILVSYDFSSYLCTNANITVLVLGGNGSTAYLGRKSLTGNIGQDALEYDGVPVGLPMTISVSSSVMIEGQPVVECISGNYALALNHTTATLDSPGQVFPIFLTATPIGMSDQLRWNQSRFQ